MNGSARAGRRIGVADLEPVDLVVCGSVAVNRQGVRCRLPDEAGKPPPGAAQGRRNKSGDIATEGIHIPLEVLHLWRNDRSCGRALDHGCQATYRTGLTYYFGVRSVLVKQEIGRLKTRCHG
jgi:hypothetical protein